MSLNNYSLYPYCNKKGFRCSETLLLVSAVACPSIAQPQLLALPYSSDTLLQLTTFQKAAM